MGLIHRIGPIAARHAHVLLVEASGHWQTRAATERAALARGWALALSPADADVLAVCGTPGPQLQKLVDRVWQQMPGPRVRVDVHRLGDVATRLEQAHTALLDAAQHRDDARTRPTRTPNLSSDGNVDDHGGMDHGGMDHGGMDHGGMDHGGMDHGGMDHGGMDHGGMDHGGMDHGGMDHGGMDHGGMDHGGMDHGGMDHGGMDHGGMDHGGMDHGGMDHGGMDHGGMDMSPGGIPLAEGGDDRDGLEMDVLRVRLGPVLPHWPAGLVLCCVLQGDVITEAQAELLDDVPQPQEKARSVVSARRMDNVVGLLALAGWDDAAARARVIRDTLLVEERRDAEVTVALDRLAARIRRSRVLRWSLRGLRPLSEADLRHHGLPPRLAGDTFDRLLRMLQDVTTGAGGDSFSVEQLPGVLIGLDVATARLVLASLNVHQLASSSLQMESSHA